MINPLNGYLADTWWYAMTARLTDEDFQRLITLRVSQGFSAVQVVVGIPPETTPNDPNAASPFGPAWKWSGEFSQEYLDFARKRIQSINQSGLTVFIYGAWGHQINWIGISRMIAWWRAVIQNTNDLDVVYCLTGESAHHLGFFDFSKSPQRWSLLLKFGEMVRKLKISRNLIIKLFHNTHLRKNRRQSWSEVLQQVAGITEKPIFIHPSPGDFGFECVENCYLLAINTVQTGHSYHARADLYRLPIAHAENNDSMGRGFVNLEPWYEGILDQFNGPDQLYSYWTSTLAGAAAYCYGAHGIWNVGDGKFLAHWGTQTFEQALQLDTPRLIGLSHQLLQPYIGKNASVIIEEKNGKLIRIQRNLKDVKIEFLPEIKNKRNPSKGKIWLPMQGCFTEQLPQMGQVVIISGNN